MAVTRSSSVLLVSFAVFVLALESCNAHYFLRQYRPFQPCPPPPRKAVCDVQPDPNSSQQVYGVVTFQQEFGQDISISVHLKGFDTGAAAEHGFHVHQYGDITGGCASTGGHYNPDNVNHGGPTDVVRHPGDFGNLKQNADGSLVTTFTDRMASLFGDKSILGRSIVVHAGVDDLGRGGNAGSLANGNAGPRLACCVIGWAPSVPLQNQDYN